MPPKDDFLEALDESLPKLKEGDVLLVASKVLAIHQGRTKKILVEREAHFNYILHYIHLNPLDYLGGAEQWRIRSHNGIYDAQEALNHLDNYRWSSYLDYAGKKNFPSVLSTSFFKDAFGDYPTTLKEYLGDAEADLTGLRLEY